MASKTAYFGSVKVPPQKIILPKKYNTNFFRKFVLSKILNILKEKFSMDEKDEIIILALLENAKISKTRIARKLGISETAVRKRISNLEKEGIILGYRAVINFKKAELFVSITGIDVESERMWEVIGDVKKIKSIKSIYLTSGEHTLVVEVFAESLNELSNVHNTIYEIKGVRKVCPSIVLDVI